MDGRDSPDDMLSELESEWYRTAWMGSPRGVQHEIDVIGETEKTLIRIGMIRSNLEMLREHLDLISIGGTRGELPDALVVQMMDRLDAVQRLVEWRCGIARTVLDG